MRDVVRDLIPVAVALDLGLVVSVVAQGVKHLSKSEMRKVGGNLLRGRTEAPEFHDRAYGDARAHNDGLATEDVVVADDVAVLGPDCHSTEILAFGVRA
jgi:hypothetical protein